MPILLVCGDQDDVPVQSLPQAAEALQNAGFSDVYAHVMKGTAHGIAPDGLVALAFIRDQLGSNRYRPVTWGCSYSDYIARSRA